MRWPQRGDVEGDAIREAGRRTFDLIARYFDDAADRPVFPAVDPAALRATLARPIPEEPEDLEAILADIEQDIVPALTHWNDPRFMAYFAISGSVPGILADALKATFNVNAMLWRTAPAATALEEVVLGWLGTMVGYPTGDGCLTNGASLGTLYALAAARQARVPDVRTGGLSGGPPLVVYTSDQAHSSVDKAAIVLGLGTDHLVRLPSDDDYRLVPAALDHAAGRDRAAGKLPLAVVATVGTTSTTSVDPVAELAAVCARHDLWLHVDAAYGGLYKIVDELAGVVGDLSAADSLILNPHKTLFVPLEVSALLCRHRGALADAFRLVPAYLESPEHEPDFMDLTPQLGRSFRALKIWMVLRAFGRRGVAARLADHARMARRLAGWVDDDPLFERLAPVPLTVVCFRCRPPGVEGAALDGLNERLLSRINASGRVFVSHTVLRPGFAIRIALANLRATDAHLEAAWRVVQESARIEVDALA